MPILKEVECLSRSGNIPWVGEIIYCFDGYFKVISVTLKPDEGDFKVVSLKLESVKK